ncbi:MAG: hypothetical protein AAF335_02805, partial [Bacteroidota bacterium]
YFLTIKKSFTMTTTPFFLKYARWTTLLLLASVRLESAEMSSKKFHNAHIKHNTIFVYNIYEREEDIFQQVATFKDHKREIISSTYNKDKDLFASIDEDMLRIWHGSTGECLYSSQIPKGTHIKQIKWYPSNQLCVGTVGNKGIQMWQNSKFTSYLEGNFSNLCFCSNGKEVVVSCDKGVQIWGKEKVTLPEHPYAVSDVAYSPNDEYLVTVSSNEAFLFTNKAKKPVCTLREHSRGINKIWLDDDRFITGSDDTTIKIWKVVKEELEGKEISYKVESDGTLEGHKGRIISLSFYFNSLISADTHGQIRIWNLSTMQCTHMWDTRCSIQNVAWKNNQQLVVTMGNEIAIYHINSQPSLYKKNQIKPEQLPSKQEEGELQEVIELLIPHKEALEKEVEGFIDQFKKQCIEYGYLEKDSIEEDLDVEETSDILDAIMQDKGKIEPFQRILWHLIKTGEFLPDNTYKRGLVAASIYNNNNQSELDKVYEQYSNSAQKKKKNGGLKQRKQIKPEQPPSQEEDDSDGLEAVIALLTRHKEALEEEVGIKNFITQFKDKCEDEKYFKKENILADLAEGQTSYILDEIIQEQGKIENFQRKLRDLIKNGYPIKVKKKASVIPKENLSSVEIKTVEKFLKTNIFLITLNKEFQKILNFDELSSDDEMPPLESEEQGIDTVKCINPKNGQVKYLEDLNSFIKKIMQEFKAQYDELGYTNIEEIKDDLDIDGDSDILMALASKEDTYFGHKCDHCQVDIDIKLWQKMLYSLIENRSANCLGHHKCAHCHAGIKSWQKMLYSLTKKKSAT